MNEKKHASSVKILDIIAVMILQRKSNLDIWMVINSAYFNGNDRMLNVTSFFHIFSFISGSY